MEFILITKDETIKNLERIWVKVLLMEAKQRREAAKMKNISNVEASDSSSLLPDEPIPTTNEGREQYFMKHLQLGEQLMQQGNFATKVRAICI
jgi:hypothetical protein